MDDGVGSYRRFLAGDQSAFAHIITEYREGLIFFINRIVRDSAAAEDIAIDVFAELIVHPHRYNGRSSLKTYLYMMGRSRALNYVKRRSKLRTVELSEVTVAAPEDPAETVIRDERRRALHAAMGALPADTRTALHLVYFEDMSYEQAARIMKKTVKQVDNLLYKGKSELRSIMGKDGANL